MTRLTQVALHQPIYLSASNVIYNSPQNTAQFILIKAAHVKVYIVCKTELALSA